MKTILQIVLWGLSIFFGYMIYKSVNGPIEFKKVRQERFQSVINKLKDIRDAQEAYKSVNNKYANNFNSLIKFVDTGDYIITTQRDSSFTRYSREYQIDLPVDTVVIDTLGTVKVKDSLFKNDDRYKTMMEVPFAQNGETFEIKADILDKNGYKAPVYEVKVKKDVVLFDQPADLRKQENTRNSVEEVNGEYVKVGSLEEVSTNGNWPPIYDRKSDN
ncbi:hypothetical protein [Croceivirga lutea]|uniref:hypothetical protein n=1 Tax=Croceivirga lutea TaxID=1775167 RepID=UPI00163B3E8B|nr:hypothetical protein [Croceivirga lutea]